jgi:anti-sigma regulatory factor (Ser/Thr protein kinase)
VAGLDVLGAVRDDALLVVSELASNAVRHSGCDSSDEVELLAELVPGALRLAVIDNGRSGEAPKRRDRDPLTPGGMGLRVVESIARRWGAERCGQVRVWAELAL